jgi:hypothetical protein
VKAPVKLIDHDGRIVPFWINGFDRSVSVEGKSRWNVVRVAFLTAENDLIKGLLELFMSLVRYSHLHGEPYLNKLAVIIDS